MATLAFKVEADYRELQELRKEVARLKTELRSVDCNITPRIEIVKLEEDLQKATRRLNDFVAQAARAGQQIKMGGFDLSGATQSTQGYSSALNNMASSAQNAKSQNAQLHITMAEGLRNVKGQARMYATAMNEAEGSTNKFVMGLKNFLVNYSAANLALRGLYASINAVREAGSTIMSFQAANSSLGAIVGLDEKQVREMKDSAEDLGKTTVFTASQVTQLQIELGKLGFEMDNIKSMTPAILNFAQATGANLADAAATAGAAMRMFGLSSKDMGENTKNAARVANALSTATTSSALNFQAISDNLAQFGPVANAMGLQLEEALALFGAIKNAGVDGSVAATSLRNIFTEMAGGKLDKYIKEPVKDIRTFIQALHDLEAAGFQGSEAVGNAMKEIGKRGGAQFLALVKANKAGEIEDIFNKITAGVEQGKVEDMGQGMVNNLQGSLKMLSSAWERFILTFQNADGVIKDVVDNATQSILDFQEKISGGVDFTKEQMETMFDVIKAAAAGLLAYNFYKVGANMYPAIASNIKGVTIPVNVELKKDEIDLKKQLEGYKKSIETDAKNNNEIANSETDVTFARREHTKAIRDQINALADLQIQKAKELRDNASQNLSDAMSELDSFNANPFQYQKDKVEGKYKPQIDELSKQSSELQKVLEAQESIGDVNAALETRAKLLDVDAEKTSLTTRMSEELNDALSQEGMERTKQNLTQEVSNKSKEKNNAVTRANTIETQANTAKQQANTIVENENTVAKNGNTSATVKGTFASLGYSVKLKAQTLWTEAATLATITLTSAMKALPGMLLMSGLMYAGEKLLEFAFAETEAEKEAKKLNEVLGKAKEEADDAKKSFEDVGKGLGLSMKGGSAIYSQSVRDMMKANGQAKNSLEDLVKMLDEYNVSYKLIKNNKDEIKGIENLTQKYEELARAIEEANTQKQYAAARDLFNENADTKKSDADEEFVSKIKDVTGSDTDAIAIQSMMNGIDWNKATEFAKKAYNLDSAGALNFRNNMLADTIKQLKDYAALTGMTADQEKKLENAIYERFMKYAHAQEEVNRKLAALAETERKNDLVRDKADMQKLRSLEKYKGMTDDAIRQSVLMEKSAANMFMKIQAQAEKFGNIDINFRLKMQNTTVPEWMKGFSADYAKRQAAFWEAKADEAMSGKVVTVNNKRVTEAEARIKALQYSMHAMEQEAKDAAKKADDEKKKDEEKERNARQENAAKKRQETLQKLEEKRKKYDEQRAENHKKWQEDIDQAEIDAMAKGTDRIIKQSEHDLEKQRHAINKKYDDERKKIIENAKSSFELDPAHQGQSATKGKKDKKTGKVEGAQGAVAKTAFNEGDFLQGRGVYSTDQGYIKEYKDAQEDFLIIEKRRSSELLALNAKTFEKIGDTYKTNIDNISEEENKIRADIQMLNEVIKTNNDLIAKGGATSEEVGLAKRQNLEAERLLIEANIKLRERDIATMRDYYSSFGNMAQKRQAIIDEGNEKMRTQTLPERIITQAQTEKKLADFDANAREMDWEGIFGNLEKMNKERLETLSTQIKEKMNSENLNVEDYKTLSERLSEVMDAIYAKENSWKEAVGLSLPLHEKRLQLIKEQKLAEEEYEQSVRNYWNAVQNEDKARQDIRDLTGKDMDSSQAQSYYKELDPKSDLAKLLAPLIEKLAGAERKTDNAESKMKKSERKKDNANGAVEESGKAAEKLKRFNEALTLVNQNMQSAKDLVSKIFGEDSDISKTFGNVADGVNSATDAFADFSSGNYVGAAMNALQAVDSFGQALGIFGDSDPELLDDMEKLAKSNEALQHAVEALSEEMKGQSITEAAGTQRQILDFMRQQESDTKGIIDRALGASSSGIFSSSHSSSHYVNEVLHAENNKVSNQISKLLGKSIKNTDDWAKLTSDEMRKVREYLPTVYARIKDASDDGKADAAQYYDQYTEFGKKVKELEREYIDFITDVTLDSMQSSVKGLFGDMESSTLDFADFFEKTMHNAVINGFMSNGVNQAIEEWQAKLKDFMENDGSLDNAEREILRKSYKEIVDKYKQEADEINKDFDIDSSQRASSRGFQGMSQDTGNELNGRFTALQVAAESINNKLVLCDTTPLQTSLESLGITSERIYSVNDEIRTILADSYLALQAIQTATESVVEPISNMQSDMNQLRRKLSEL